MKWKPSPADLSAFESVCSHYKLEEYAIVIALIGALQTGKRAFVIYRMIAGSL